MIRLARELGLKVVVEGVESIAQLALLADWGCDLYQGFLGAGALDEAELARFVAASHGRAPPKPAPAPSSRFAAPRRTRTSPREICSAPLSRASPVGQSRLTTSLLSGRSLAAPFSRST